MKRIYIAALIIFITSLNFSQSGSNGAVDARSMSMAKTYNAVSNGVYCIGINPANLMSSDNRYFEFSTLLPLPGVGISTGTNFISLKDFNYFFGGVDGKARLLNQDDKKRLNDLFEDGGQLFGSVSMNIFSAMYKAGPKVGAFAFSISDFAAAKFTMPKALVDLGLYGNKINTGYDFRDAEMDGSWLRYYSLSYAREFPEIEQSLFQTLSAGITLKIVTGYSYASMDQVNTTISTGAANQIAVKSDMVLYSAMSEDFGTKYDFDSTSSNNESNMSPFPTPSGSGFGMDFGFAASMDNTWKFSLAVTDIGKMTWDNKAVKYTASGSIIVTDLTNEEQMDSLEDKLKSKGSYIGSFSSDLPTTLRLGASYIFNKENDDIPGSLLIALDYNQGLNNAAGNSITPRFSLGSEWIPVRWFVLRTGLSVGGLDGFNWALGLGFNSGLIEFNFATTDMQSFVAPNAAKKLSFSMGSRWKI